MVSKKKKLKLYFDTLENTWTNYRAIFGFFLMSQIQGL